MAEENREIVIVDNKTIQEKIYFIQAVLFNLISKRLYLWRGLCHRDPHEAEICG